MLDTRTTDNKWNIRIIPDTDLVITYVHGIHLVANVDKTWVAYRMVTAGELDFHTLWRGIQAAIALRGAHRVAQLVGIVVGSKKMRLKGMLTELPSKTPMFQIMSACRIKSNPVPWPIRQKWAKQVVRGVAAFHERRRVVADLRTYNWSVCIDGHSNGIVSELCPGNHPIVYSEGGLLPPEYRTDAFEKSDGQVGPEFDVFQLDVLSWHLYRDQDQQHGSTFCLLVGCNNANLSTCDEHHNPVLLPKASAHVPDYLDKIITLCRQADPRARPTAWEIIHLFPTEEEILLQIDLLRKDQDAILPGWAATSKTSSLVRLEVVRELYPGFVLCDICSERCPVIYYSCVVCNHGNYDLCTNCFVEGQHCRDRTHLLRKPHFARMTNRITVGSISCFSTNEKGESEEIVI